jgi:hypothetical protein
MDSSPTLTQALEKPFCVEHRGGWKSCIYDSLVECERATADRRVDSDCVANPEQFGTTGQGGMDSIRNPTISVPGGTTLGSPSR